MVVCTMREDQKTAFGERQKTAAAAKAALLAKFKPKPAATDPLHAERASMRKTEIDTARKERLAAKAVIAQEALEAKAAAALLVDQQAEEALIALRGERKERKTLSKADAKAKRDAKYAARQSRR